MSNLDEIVFFLKEAINNNQDFIMPVKGTSMLPFIDSEMKVTVTKVNELKKNDIIFYQRENGQYVMHRIYKIKKDKSMVLLGDNQTQKEYPVYPKQVLAKVKNVLTQKETKELKGFSYHLYLFFWNQLLLRKVILKLRRMFNGK